MCEVLATITESTPSPEEENSRLEQLMISMLEVHYVCVDVSLTMQVPMCALRYIQSVLYRTYMGDNRIANALQSIH